MSGLGSFFSSGAANLLDGNLQKMIASGISTDMGQHLGGALRDVAFGSITGGAAQGIIVDAIKSAEEVQNIAKQEILEAEQAGIAGFSYNSILVGGLSVDIHTYLKENGDIGILTDGVAKQFEEGGVLEALGDDYRSDLADIVRKEQNDVAQAGGRAIVQRELEAYTKEQIGEDHSMSSPQHNNSGVTLSAPTAFA